MQKQIAITIAIGFFASLADAALLEILAGGADSVDLAPGESVEISIVLTIRDIDPGFAFANVFLNDNDDQAAGPLSVTELQPCWKWIPEFQCDRSAFTLPADISHNQENEYGLVMGRTDGENWGTGTHVLDVLTVTHTGDETSGMIEVTFEAGARMPQIMTQDYVVYVWGLGLDGVIGGFADPGVGSHDHPLVINLVPGPPCEGDANGDRIVNPLDSGFVLARFGCEVDAGDPDCDTADQNDDGEVDPLDVGYVAARFGTCE